MYPIVQQKIRQLYESIYFNNLKMCLINLYGIPVDF